MVQITSEQVIDKLGIDWFRGLSSFGALSEKAIIYLLDGGRVLQLKQGEVLCQYGMEVTGFTIVIKGDIAFYKHFKEQDILTRHFCNGEQIGFDAMLAMITYSGTEVAAKDSIVVHISKGLFFDMHMDFADEFGLFMLNLARELSREISVLEAVIGESIGWSIDRSKY